MAFIEAIEPRVLYATTAPRPHPAVAPPGPPAPPLAGNWNLAFDDEFNGTSLASPWTPHQYWANGPTVGEGLEESDPANVAVSNGALQLTARINNAFGTQYTGALVQTGGNEAVPGTPTFGFLYGYAEARIQVPGGAGFWPAFWMLTVNHIDDDGELDVMEMYDTDTTSAYGTVHRFDSQQQHRDSTGTDLSAGWHTFGVDWEPDHITWYLDGSAYATTTSPSLIPNVPMFPILDLAVGGPNNPPTAGTPFPATMSVDWVHVWQQSVQGPPALIGAPLINGDDPNGLYTAAGQTTPGMQRSMVRDVVYTFNQPVEIPDPNAAFSVVGTGPHPGAAPSTLIASAVPGSNGTQWAVSLTGKADGVLASIANGEYGITINPASVFAAADGTTSMAAGTGRTDRFFRLFGDINGDGTVNGYDEVQFGLAIRTYDPAFDFNGDGAVNAFDEVQAARSIGHGFAGDGFVTTIG